MSRALIVIDGVVWFSKGGARGVRFPGVVSHIDHLTLLFYGSTCKRRDGGFLEVEPARNGLPRVADNTNHLTLLCLGFYS